VLGYVAGSLALAVTVWLMIPWRPRLAPRRSHLPKMLRFGGILTLVDINAAVQSNLDYIFIGRILGPAQLGLYTIGFRVPGLLIGNVTGVAGRVLFPAFAAVDRRRLGEAFLLSLKYTLMFALPLTAAVAVLAEPITLAVFGDQWRRSVPVMQLITIWSLAVAIGIPAGTAYKSTGRPGVLLALGIPRTLLLAAAIAIFVDEGIVAVAACLAVVTGLSSLVNLGLASRLLEVRVRAIWSAAWPAIAAAAGMAAVLILVDRTIASPWPTLLAGASLWGCAYLVLVWVLARDSLRYLREMAFPRANAPKEAVTPSETPTAV
jgi:O-antigen/teichoic acid export membrane protein